MNWNLQMKWMSIMKINSLSIAKISIISCSLLLSGSVFAYDFNTMVNNTSQALSTYTLDCAHWYVGANLGMSHLHDDANPGSSNSVDENGPGGSVVAGYQFNSILGTELGYTQYKNSREMSGSTMIARTDHYAVDLAATGRYPIMTKWSALGKLGAAYSYAQKTAVGSGVSQSSGAGSVYWGLGLDYSLTPKIDVIGQFAEVVGNHLTGSTDLWSVGLNVALI